MSSKVRRKDAKAARIVNSWSRSEKTGNVKPYMKCVLAALHDEGLRGVALYEAFASMVPNWRKFFDKPISDAAPVQRADKARRGGKYSKEAPEAHPVMAALFPLAVKDVASGTVWSNAELREAFGPKAKPAGRKAKQAAEGAQA